MTDHDNLRTYSRHATTKGPESQTKFERGLA